MMNCLIIPRHPELKLLSVYRIFVSSHKKSNIEPSFEYILNLLQVILQQKIKLLNIIISLHSSPGQKFLLKLIDTLKNLPKHIFHNNNYTLNMYLTPSTPRIYSNQIHITTNANYEYRLKHSIFSQLGNSKSIPRQELLPHKKSLNHDFIS